MQHECHTIFFPSLANLLRLQASKVPSGYLELPVLEDAEVELVGEEDEHEEDEDVDRVQPHLVPRGGVQRGPLLT